MQNKNCITRRNFIKSSAAISMAAMTMSKAFAAGSDKLKIGIIGCGGRGTGALSDCLHSSENIELVAMADIFQWRFQNSLNELKKGSQWIKAFTDESRINVPEERRFLGFDAYKKLIALDDIDIVLLTTPPAFRPIHLKAAVEAGKHVFMEKPVAVDPAGIRSVIKSAEIAKQKRLSIVGGTQRRHQDVYIDIMKRIRDGQIGEIVAGQCYWNTHAHKYFDRYPGHSDVEHQLANWHHYCWTSGDHIVEQHVHNLDVMNWAMGTHPVKCLGIGGRAVRTDMNKGNIYDHFTVEFEYPNGAKITSMCRQQDGCTTNVSERVVGTKGISFTDGATGKITTDSLYKYKGQYKNPYVQEHADLINSIRNNEPINEAKQIAESTMTGIMGRVSAYTGRALKWDWLMNASKLSLVPEDLKFGPKPVEPPAIPGKTKLI